MRLVITYKFYGRNSIKFYTTMQSEVALIISSIWLRLYKQDLTRLSPKAKIKRHLSWKSKTLLLVGAMYCETRAFYNLLFFLLTVDSVACEQQTQFRSSVLSLRKIASANPSGKTISVTWNHRPPRRSMCHWMNSNILIFTWTN